MKARAVQVRSWTGDNGEYLMGKRAIQEAVGLNRCATDWVIQRGEFPVMMIAELLCARRADVDSWLRRQGELAARPLHAWADDGGACHD